jgi:hypothetical protein
LACGWLSGKLAIAEREFRPKDVHARTSCEKSPASPLSD